ncbi:non-heme iron oxygenase ferredoxin subunit [Isoptericola variabilis]|uniref:Rieske (2Fe-2S) iron-sulfur domain protein n=1 Tax=Isoptericola variabilis (strain 225) TaxID=743718 RepID=F6FT66_ISOV2|nr:non-heme iron oxygenase ferredoxin subunit [Isoptericola variabilis]AEG44137.1 Rieske (2Fe-2S) iron-sulfur domain protein [Isoptericola variabilis 225]TWH28549.1 3-phenylpropionate/trans-cinnamate dioxygenase ferredoxin subunit [Isoptericola variabilis J7]
MTKQLACMVDDLGPEEAMLVELDGVDGAPVPVALVRDADGDFHALSDVCSHGAVSLSDGEVEGCLVECWLHGSQFDVRTGKPVQLPATQPVPVYPVTVEGDRVLVDVDEPLAVAS